jgi:hypothetical protein
MILRKDMTAEEVVEQEQLLDEGWHKELFGREYDIWFEKYCNFMCRVQTRLISEGKVLEL